MGLNQLSKFEDPDDKLPSLFIYQGVVNIDNFIITVPKTPGNYVYLWGWSGYRNCVQVKVDAAVNLKPTLTSTKAPTAPKPTMAPKPTSKPTSPPSPKPTSAPPPTSKPTSAPPPTSKPTSDDIETLDNAAGLLRPLMIVIASASTALLA